MKAAVLACFLAFVAIAATELVELGKGVAVKEKLELDEGVAVEEKVDVLPELSAEKAAALAQDVIAKSVSEEAALSKLPPSEELTRQIFYCRPRPCGRSYRPVCGFSLCNGVRTFTSICELNNYNQCNYPGYNILYYGRCELFVRCYRRTFFDLATFK